MLRPSELVTRAERAGLTTISVTDHDTTGGLDEARESARDRGIRFIDGIEITAVEAERDTHVLGYFFDPKSPSLRAFLERQRADRIRRVREMAARLESLGIVIDAEPLVARGMEEGRSVGRPHVAAALLAGGYVTSWDEAFEKYLEKGRPAFVPRAGASALEVVEIIHEARGIASLAHPGLTRIDPVIPALAAAGLDAIEAAHSEHDAETEARYRAMASALGVAVTAGSDFHGDAVHEPCAFGRITMTAGELAAFEARRR